MTDPATLVEPMKGMDTVAITVGYEGKNSTLMKAVEFTGVENQAASLAQASGSAALADKRVVLCSSMATTDPHPLPFMGGPVLFWKLNAEASLQNMGIGSAIVKPCGIEGTYGRGGKQLLIGHDDTLLGEPIRLPSLRLPGRTQAPPCAGSRGGAISRADVAAVMLEAVVQRSSGLRFDLCVGGGPATTDLAALLESTRYPWEKQQQTQPLPAH